MPGEAHDSSIILVFSRTHKPSVPSVAISQTLQWHRRQLRPPRAPSMLTSSRRQSAALRSVFCHKAACVPAAGCQKLRFLLVHVELETVRGAAQLGQLWVAEFFTFAGEGRFQPACHQEVCGRAPPQPAWTVGEDPQLPDQEVGRLWQACEGRIPLFL